MKKYFTSERTYLHLFSSASLFLISYSLFLISLSSCSVSKQVDKFAKQDIINKPGLTTAHVGISIYDPGAKKYLYNYDGDKYFIPASNTKIITCYAAMKYLGDSLVGAKIYNDDGNAYIFPTGDPTFLHPDFANQNVFNYLKFLKLFSVTFLYDSWQENALGSGWSWDDYNDDYMAERSAFPIYGNIFRIFGKEGGVHILPVLPNSYTYYGSNPDAYLSKAVRTKDSNNFTFEFNGKRNDTFHIPFVTFNGKSNEKILSDTLHVKIFPKTDFIPFEENDKSIVVIHSQPTDSLLKIMMHRSDNFYAEQSLLMVSNEMLGIMNDEKIIDTLLKTDFKDMPQKPSWVDGSGLSRYNLFTPQDFIFVLDKMRNEFSWNRITTIFASGGNGTLGGAFKNMGEKIYAKTGTLSNNASLSGYIITKKNKTLIFSVQVGNHVSSAGDIRNSVAEFLTSVIDKY